MILSQTSRSRSRQSTCRLELTAVSSHAWLSNRHEARRLVGLLRTPLVVLLAQALADDSHILGRSVRHGRKRVCSNHRYCERAQHTAKLQGPTPTINPAGVNAKFAGRNSGQVTSFAA